MEGVDGDDALCGGHPRCPGRCSCALTGSDLGHETDGVAWKGASGASSGIRQTLLSSVACRVCATWVKYGQLTDQPKQIGFRKLDRQVPTNENQLSPVPVPVPVPQVPSPKPSNREPQHVPVQFNSPGHRARPSPAIHRFLLSPSLPLCLSIQSCPSASALRYVTSRAPKLCAFTVIKRHRGESFRLQLSTPTR